ncbi:MULTISPECIES: transglutaminase-like cysteine peptidase [unclassified Vibrio]|uniref:Transglutaminase-like cysteine peptidase n=1 Tax=Vibrio sp. HB236076 TaxID=3232307 RepID=A0AB39HGL6_9VIBR|nr:transglutaminase-like cysteine peptidase [Vibrio sp. HB161653]MDP5252588.1 transglutaminase-like cysteine peptidase [Vibrio sp. HB161653]
MKKLSAFLTTIILVCASVFGLANSTSDQMWVNAVTESFGPRAGQRVQAWRTLIEQGQRDSTMEKLNAVNDFFNSLYFVDDIYLWGKNDYWATPLEFLGANAGDCEDFTIAKYFSLLELGVPDDKLRLIYVKALKLNQFHMVLAYYPTPSSVPLILDNLDKSIKPASSRGDLLPIYSFNGKNLWLIKSSSSNGKVAGNASRLSLWNDLRSRAKKMEFNKPIINYDE